MSEEPKKLIDVPEFTALYNALKELDAKPNIISLARFQQFEPIFQRRHGLSTDQINELTERYCKTIDLYKPIVITESDAADSPVIETLPAAFVPFRALAATQQNAALVDINEKMGHSNIPLHSSTAFGRLGDALLAEQKNNQGVVDTYRAETVTIMEKFFSNHGLKQPDGNAVAGVPSTDMSSNVAWEFE